MEKMKLVMILALLGGILMAVSLAMPWYYQETEIAGESTRADFFWTEVEGEEDTTSYEDAEQDNTGSVFQTTQIFAILGTVFSFLAFLFVMLKMKGSLGLGTPIIMIVVLLGFIFSILAPVYLMTALPGARGDDMPEGMEDEIGYTDSFSGSKEVDGGLFGTIKTTWGGGTGWILALVAGILNLIAFVFFMMSKNEL